jgi:hypothetical protein
MFMNHILAYTISSDIYLCLQIFIACFCWLFCNCLLLVYHYRWLQFSTLVSLGLAYFLRGSFLCSLNLISFVSYAIRYPFNACGCCCGRFWLFLLIHKCRNLYFSLSFCRHIDLINISAGWNVDSAGTLVSIYHIY